MAATPFHGATISFRLSEQVAMFIVNVAMLWSGAKRTVTYHFLHSLQQQLLPPSRRHQLLKLMATRWHLMAVDAAVSLRIDSNTVKE